MLEVKYAVLIAIAGMFLSLMIGGAVGIVMGMTYHQTNRTCILVPAGDPTAQPYCVWGESR